jgi:5'-phosphate synthase pdxT subunit
VEPHRRHIAGAGGEFRAVRTESELSEVDALILPGGESTTMLWLIRAGALHTALEGALQRIPVWGICAGAILLASDVQSPSQESFGALSMSVRRNAYGRQLDSFSTQIAGYPVCFIRAPRIVKVEQSVQVRARDEAGATWVSCGQVTATCFHPELTAIYPSPWHQDLVNQARLVS